MRWANSVWLAVFDECGLRGPIAVTDIYRMPIGGCKKEYVRKAATRVCLIVEGESEWELCTRLINKRHCWYCSSTVHVCVLSGWWWWTKRPDGRGGRRAITEASITSLPPVCWHHLLLYIFHVDCSTLFLFNCRTNLLLLFSKGWRTEGTKNVWHFFPVPLRKKG